MIARMKKVFLALCLLLAAAVLAGALWLRHFEYREMYAPAAAIGSTPAQFQLRYQAVQFLALETGLVRQVEPRLLAREPAGREDQGEEDRQQGGAGRGQGHGSS